MKHSVQSMLFAVLAGVAINAHALCVNLDGSLDDASVTREAIAVDILPACKGQGMDATAAEKTEDGEKKQQEKAPVKPAVKSKTSGKSASIHSDCRAANGENMIGYIGATELLPECAL